MNNAPILSICIPTYNREELIYECVNEILKSKSKEIEVVVSDNASSDNTRKRLKKISDSRFHYRKNKKNNKYLNIVNALEFGKGDWLLLLSDESRFLDLEQIEEMIKQLTINPDISMMLYNVMTSDGTEVRSKFDNRRYSRGIEAFKIAGTVGFMPGLIFNRKLIDFKQVWKMLSKINSNGLTVLYPQICIECMLLQKGDIYCNNTVLVREVFKPNMFYQKWSLTRKNILDLLMYTNGKIKMREKDKFAILLNIISNYFYMATWDHMTLEDFSTYNFNNKEIIQKYYRNILMYELIYKNCIAKIIGCNFKKLTRLYPEIWQEFIREKETYKESVFLSINCKERWIDSFYKNEKSRLSLI